MPLNHEEATTNHIGLAPKLSGTATDVLKGDGSYGQITIDSLSDGSSGTWTPVLTFATVGDLAVTYTTQKGTYRKIGSLVVAIYNIVTSAFTYTTSVGALEITGLPFANIAGAGNAAPGKVSWSGITKAGYTEISSSVAINASLLTFLGSGSGVARATIVATDVPSAGSIILQGVHVYFTP